MDARVEIRALWQRVAAGRRRAARAASLAVRHETQVGLAPESLRALHVRMRDLYRQIEARHLAAVRVTELHASRMERWHPGSRSIRGSAAGGVPEKSTDARLALCLHAHS